MEEIITQIKMGRETKTNNQLNLRSLRKKVDTFMGKLVYTSCGLSKHFFLGVYRLSTTRLIV